MNNQPLDTNLILQTAVVALLVIASLVWIIFKIIRKRSITGCEGCSLSSCCNSKGKNKEMKLKKH